MVAGERDLRGADEVEVVLLLHAVDLGVVRDIEAGALHRLRAHEGRRDHRGEVVRDGLVERHLQQRQLEACADTLEEVEARTGDLRAALHVDRADELTDLEVILRLEVERRGLTDRLDGDEVVLATRRHAVEDDVGDGAKQRVDDHPGEPPHDDLVAPAGRVGHGPGDAEGRRAVAQRGPVRPLARDLGGVAAVRIHQIQHRNPEDER